MRSPPPAHRAKLPESALNPCHSDALVFFGASGDPAYKKIFPALQAMASRGSLTVPVVYERLLTEAMRGDSTLFARKDSVEQAWRIVEPILGTVTPNDIFAG